MKEKQREEISVKQTDNSNFPHQQPGALSKFTAKNNDKDITIWIENR